MNAQQTICPLQIWMCHLPLFVDGLASDACDDVDVDDACDASFAAFFVTKIANGCPGAFDFWRTIRAVPRGKVTDASNGFFFISPVLDETVTLPTVRLSTTNIMSSTYEISGKIFEVIFNFS